MSATPGDNYPENKKVLARALSLEAWRTSFHPATKRAALYIAASFGRARMGKTDDWPIPCAIRIRKAEIWVVMQRAEPVSVVPGSVYDPVRRSRLTIREAQGDERKESKSARREASFSVTNLGAGGGSGTSAETCRSTNRDLEAEFETLGFRICHFEDGGSHYWEIEPETGAHLDGGVWDRSEPRLLLERSGGDTIEPIIRVEIRCCREDLDIQLIPERNQGEDGAPPPDDTVARLAAAESCLREAILAQGLEADFDQPLGIAKLASIVVVVVD